MKHCHRILFMLLMSTSLIACGQNAPTATAQVSTNATEQELEHSQSPVNLPLVSDPANATLLQDVMNLTPAEIEAHRQEMIPGGEDFYDNSDAYVEISFKQDWQDAVRAWSYTWQSDDDPYWNHGIVIKLVQEDKVFLFPELYGGDWISASYEPESNYLYIKACAGHGTGYYQEILYAFCVDEGEIVYLGAQDPYEITQLIKPNLQATLDTTSHTLYLTLAEDKAKVDENIVVTDLSGNGAGEDTAAQTDNPDPTAMIFGDWVYYTFDETTGEPIANLETARFFGPIDGDSENPTGSSTEAGSAPINVEGMPTITVNILTDRDSKTPITLGKAHLTGATWQDQYQAILADPALADRYLDLDYEHSYFGSDYGWDQYYLYDMTGDDIPELFLKSDSMGLTVVYTWDEYAGLCGLWCDMPAGILTSKAELLVNGHWHGAGGSGKFEWSVYRYNPETMTMDSELYLDAFPEDFQNPDWDNARYIVMTGTDFRRNPDEQNREHYDKYYDEHIKPMKAVSEIPTYDLTDLTAFR